jgi:hypothetical protein
MHALVWLTDKKEGLIYSLLHIYFCLSLVLNLEEFVIITLFSGQLSRGCVEKQCRFIQNESGFGRVCIKSAFGTDISIKPFI